MKRRTMLMFELLDQRREASNHALQAMPFSIPGRKGRVNSMVAP